MPDHVRMHAPRPPLACVIGEVDLVRALGLAGIRSAVVAPPGNPARWSRTVEAVLGWSDPWREPEALVERLVAFGTKQPSPPVLYYDGDWDLLLVSRHRERLGTAFRFTVAAADLVEDLVDKARFQGLAERLGLPVPAGVRLRADDAFPATTGLSFPVVAKPLTRQHATWKPLVKAKAFPVQDPAGLRALWERLRERGVDVLVQEAVPGPESRIESYHVYVDADGGIAGEFTGRKLRTHPPGYGYSTALTITRSDDVAALGRDVAARLGLRGVAKLDFKRAPDGRLHLLEVNPRFNLWHHPGALAGVNLPALVYCDLAGLPRPAATLTADGIRWCSLAHDWQAARANGIGLGRWAAWAIACEGKSGFAWDDPLPLARAALWRLGRAARAGR
jgi:D-aspartate ligase